MRTLYVLVCPAVGPLRRFPFATVRCFFQGQGQTGFPIGARLVPCPLLRSPSSLATALRGTTLPAGRPKKLLKKATEPTAARESKIVCTAEVEPDVLIPWRRRSPALLCCLPGSAIAIVLGVFVGVLGNFVRLANIFEFVLGVWGFADIRMVLASQLPIGALNVFLGGILCNPESYSNL